ncbi:MAG: response regulator [Pseudomonadota bacterium]
MPEAASLHVTNRILVVEDDDQVRRSIKLFLRGRGYDVDAYSSAAELLSLHPRPRADCLLIDYKMARMDGLDLLKRLRAEGDETPALMLTGFFSQTLRDRAIDVGFTDVMEKPTGAQALMSKISSILDAARNTVSRRRDPQQDQ